MEYFMKKMVLITLALLFIYVSSTALTHVPTPVSKTFDLKFPNAKNIKWDKENKNEYEAAFSLDGIKYTASFNEKGEWLETETNITFNILPEKVQQAFNTSYKDSKIKAVAKIENSKGEIKYEIEIKQKNKTVEKFFKSDGTEIKK